MQTEKGFAAHSGEASRRLPEDHYSLYSPLCQRWIERTEWKFDEVNNRIDEVTRERDLLQRVFTGEN